MEGGEVVSNVPRTVEAVLRDYMGRRSGILKALTQDVEAFCLKCDPEKENLCLYGYNDGTWNVDLPAEEVPPELPEPALGINFARDGMERKDWLSLVAVHSDAWLYAVAFYHGARFDRNDRRELFKMMNELPTVFDVVTGRKPVREKTNNSAAKKQVFWQSEVGDAHPAYKQSSPKDDEEYDEEDDEHGETLCGSCGESYTADEFWIGCDICDKWFHGKCVKITAAKAEHIKQYKCPSCSNKRARVS